MKVRDIMSVRVCCVSPDTTLEQASRLMSDSDIGVAPVCDASGIVGMVTDRDIVTRGLSKGYGPETKIRNVMSSGVVSVSPDADIGEAARLMSDCQVRRLPVLSGREIVGIVSVGDLARTGKLDAEVARAETGIADFF